MNAEKRRQTEKTAIGVAHSKLILVGEHAVVHGQPAIAIPFPHIGVESIVEYVPGKIKIDSTFYHGPIESAPDLLTGVVKCIEETLTYLQLPHRDLLIQIKSSIPPGKGLGSSASVAIAVIKSLFHYANVEYSEEKLLSLANIAETYAHGTPSGIDPLTITSECPVWFEKEQPADYIRPQNDFYFIVADSGRMADTKTAIESITNLIKSAPRRFQAKLDRLGKITHQAREALEKAGKNVLGQLLNEAQKELEALGVSDAVLNKLVYFALEEGALGAKLTGGGNGGCIIALARNEVHSKHLTEKLIQYGAQAVWPFVLRKKD